MWESFVRILALASVLKKVPKSHPGRLCANSARNCQPRPPTLKFDSAMFCVCLSELAAFTVLFVFISDCSITKFLNRILGLEVHKQNCLFQYFTDNFDYLIEKDKKEGKYDMGILGMGVSLKNARF